jgi:hypothetical protein
MMYLAMVSHSDFFTPSSRQVVAICFAHETSIVRADETAADGIPAEESFFSQLVIIKYACNSG